jgi:hypothetical protein
MLKGCSSSKKWSVGNGDEESQLKIAQLEVSGAMFMLIASATRGAETNGNLPGARSGGDGRLLQP